MIITTIYVQLTSGTAAVVAAKLALGILLLSSFITLVRLASRSKTHGGVLPGVPELKGVPILGALPLYLRKGIPHVISRMIEIGADGGIAYASVVSSVLVSVHEPTLVKEVLGFPDEIASREGDTSTGMSWSPFWTLRRMIGNLSLFNYVGPETRHQRSVFIREFNSTKSNRQKFPTIARLAKQHCANPVPSSSQQQNHHHVDNTMSSSAHVVNDIRLAADNFAISLWGDVLYANPDNHLDDGGQVRTLSNKIMDLAGDPWPAIWYYLQQVVLGLLSPGEPTRSEALLRIDIEGVIGRNISRLMAWESAAAAANKDDEKLEQREMKTLRSLSVQTGGGATGPLSKFATEFANLNLFGGHHSIGLNVVWAIIELGRHPDKMRRLVEEIDSATTKATPPPPAEAVTSSAQNDEDDDHEEDWTLDYTKLTNQMPYLDAVLTEVNRLYPTVHATLRVINKDVVLKGTCTSSTSSSPSFKSTGTSKNLNLAWKGKREEVPELPTTIPRETKPVILRKGMIVYLSYWHLHTAEKYWGKDTKNFIPERFLPRPDELEFVEGDEKKKKKKNTTRPIGPLMSFGYGPRSCVGYKFASIAAKVYLVTLLKMYKVEVRGTEHGMKLGTLLEPGRPVAVALTRR